MMKHFEIGVSPDETLKLVVYISHEIYTAISIKVVLQAKRKSRILVFDFSALLGGQAFISDSQQPFALVFDFSALLGGQP